jgi:hypothetical protein
MKQFSSFLVACVTAIAWLSVSAMAEPMSSQSNQFASPMERADVLEHNGTCKNKHRLRHNGKYRKHCKEQHGVELKKK